MCEVHSPPQKKCGVFRETIVRMKNGQGEMGNGRTVLS